MLTFLIGSTGLLDIYQPSTEGILTEKFSISTIGVDENIFKLSKTKSNQGFASGFSGKLMVLVGRDYSTQFSIHYTICFFYRFDFANMLSQRGT